MKGLLKAAGYLAAFALLAVVCFVLTLYYGWEWWIGVALFVALCGALFALGWLGRRLARALARRRGTEGEAAARAAPAPQPGRLSDVLGQWKQGLATLKASSLAQRGNPIYALPWIAVLGTTGAGKSTALQRAHLASAIQATSLTGHLPITQTLEWWFFDRAVALDLSGRYCAQDMDAGTQAEWNKILSLIARTRRREPLNGVVVTIGADELLHGTPEKLVEHVRAIRNRLDQLMRATDTRFPVYVLVTKCDGLFGLAEWSQHLPPGSLRQALGYVHPGAATDAKSFLDAAFNSVDNRLRDLRLVITREVEHASAGLMLFPNEFERLRVPLESVFSVAFGDDPYTETPLLRGLFFSSAAQGGGVSSFVLNDTNLPDQTVVLMVKEQSLFLQDVFSRVIPADRWLHQPLGRSLRWERHTYQLGVAAWFLLALGIGGILTASFVRSWTTIADLRVAYAGVPELTGRLPQDVNTLSRHLELLKVVEARTSDWLTRVVPFNDDVHALAARLQYAFLASFRNQVLAPIDARLAQRISPTGGAIAAAGPADVQFIVRRLNMVRAAGEGETAAQLERMPEPAPDVATLARIHGEISPYDLTPDTVRAFGRLYRYYLDWASESEALETERKLLQNWLAQITATGDQLAWLTDWANEQPKLQAVTLNTFWPGSHNLTDAPIVTPGYTREGKQAIERFLDEIASSMATRDFAGRRAEFESGYRARRLQHWHAFAGAFERGKLLFASDTEWSLVLAHLGGERDPYLAFLTRLTSELADITDADAPAWLHLARRIDTIRGLGRRDGVIGEARRVQGVLARSAPEVVRETIDRGVARGKSLVDAQLAAGHAFGTYVTELQKAAKDAQAGVGQAAQVAAAFHLYGDDPTVKDSALIAAHNALNELRSALAREAGDDRAIWSVVAGPLTFAIQYAELQAACHLQAEWEKAVLAPLRTAASPAEANDMLYGSKGLLAAFADGPARAFMRQDAHAYTLTRKLGFQPPLEDGLTAFFNRAADRQREIALRARGAEVQKEQARILEQRRTLELENRKQEVQKRLKALDASLADLRQQQDKVRTATSTITVHGLPTHANPDAKSQPFATLLTVQCAPEPRTMANYNFPVNTTITWNPQSCGDVTLSIRIADLELVHRYRGERGMVDFATEFRDGERRFTPEDFPAQRAALEVLQVKSISVRFQLGGHLPLLRQSEQLASLAQKQAELVAERTRLTDRMASLDKLTVQDKAAGLDKDQQALALKERALAEPTAADEGVPRQIARCWQPEPEWLLGRVPTREIPPPAGKPLATPHTAPAATGEFTIQLGAFGPENTVRILANLRADGMDALVQKLDRPAGPWYRVRVGRYASRDQAERDLEHYNLRYRVSGAVMRHDPAFQRPDDPALGLPVHPSSG